MVCYLKGKGKTPKTSRRAQLYRTGRMLENRKRTKKRTGCGVAEGGKKKETATRWRRCVYPSVSVCVTGVSW